MFRQQNNVVKDAELDPRRVRFSFKAKKGFLGATISGVIRVNQESVIMDSDLPGLVTAFVSEDQIRNAINKQLDGLFPA